MIIEGSRQLNLSAGLRIRIRIRTKSAVLTSSGSRIIKKLFLLWIWIYNIWNLKQLQYKKFSKMRIFYFVQPINPINIDKKMYVCSSRYLMWDPNPVFRCVGSGQSQTGSTALPVMGESVIFPYKLSSKKDTFFTVLFDYWVW